LIDGVNSLYLDGEGHPRERGPLPDRIERAVSIRRSSLERVPEPATPALQVAGVILFLLERRAFARRARRV
jgi:hypothetical protein